MKTRMCFVLLVEKVSGAWVHCLLTLHVVEPLFLGRALDHVIR